MNMRRGRFLATIVVAGVMLVTAAGGLAATPHRLFTHNAVTQGYPPMGGSAPSGGQLASGGGNAAGPGSQVLGQSTGGTLPFTGAQLAVFALVGLALVGGGLAARRIGRSRADG
jgi:hypothetical protein